MTQSIYIDKATVEYKSLLLFGYFKNCFSVS